MVEKQQVPDGCQEIPLWRNVSGNNFHPQYVIVGYTIVDDVNFQGFNQYQWFMKERNNGDCDAVRYVNQGGRMITIYMAREIVGLPQDVGHGSGEVDHRNYNTLDNRRRNLRVVTISQSRMHTRNGNSRQLPKGVHENGNGYHAGIRINSSIVWFTTLFKKNEAWFMRKEAEKYVQGEYACSEDIPEDQMPTEERQQWLRELVIETLRKKGILV